MGESNGLATASEAGVLRVHDPATGSIEKRIFVGSKLRRMRLARRAERVVVHSSPDGKAMVYDLGSGHRLLSRPSEWGPDLCPDGGLLATNTGEEVIVTDVPTGRVRNRLKTRAGRAWFAPDGLELAIATGLKTKSGSLPRAAVRFFRLPEGTPSQAVGLPMISAGVIAFTSAGTAVVGGGMAGGLGVVRRKRGVRADVLNTMTGYHESLAISHDARLLAVGSHHPFIEIWDARKWRRVRRVASARGGTRGLAFSPSDRYLAALGRDGSVRISRTSRP